MNHEGTEPSEAIQQDRWYQHQCVLCAESMPQGAGFSQRYCGVECRKAMTKLIRQRVNREKAARKAPSKG